jgi:transketolase
VISSTEDIALKARRSVLEMVHRANSSHVGSSLSVVDILSVLYGGVANVSATNLHDRERDLVIVSKGHAAAATYAVLAEVGILPLEWLKTYSADGAVLGGHVTSHGVPGVELSTGSLGHGLPFALGVAIAASRAGSSRKSFVVMSDGECDEGTTWESAMLAAHHRLGNLVVIIDRNGIQSLGSTESTVQLEPFAEKWRAFRWDVYEVDGHDHEALRDALNSPPTAAPRVIIASTVKGKGVSFMENTVLWHYRSPNDGEFAAAMEELSQ